MVRNCQNCEKEFKVRSGREKTSFWCSKTCSYKNRVITPESRLKMRESHLGKGTKRYEKIYRQGYIFIHMPTHPNAHKQGYIAEHRLVMSNHVGRPLVKGEVVHHINEKTDDNRIENLHLCVSAGQHTKEFHKEVYLKSSIVCTKHGKYAKPKDQWVV